MYAVQITGQETGLTFTLPRRYATLPAAEAAIERLRKAERPACLIRRKAVASS